MGQYVPLHHPHTTARGVFSITDGGKVPAEARRSFSQGLFTPPEQLQRVGRLRLRQTDTLSSRAPTSLQVTEEGLTWQKSGSRFGGRGGAPPKVTEPYSRVAPPPIGLTAEGTQTKVRFTATIQLDSQSCSSGRLGTDQDQTATG